jgi:hypothetical protein
MNNDNIIYIIIYSYICGGTLCPDLVTPGRATLPPAAAVDLPLSRSAPRQDAQVEVPRAT